MTIGIRYSEIGDRESGEAKAEVEAEAREGMKKYMKTGSTGGRG